LEYKKSAAILKKRIDEISKQIREIGDDYDGLKKQLFDRRALLYTELTGLQYAIRELMEYKAAVGARVAIRAG
jgi:flagellar capping protein FliD